MIAKSIRLSADCLKRQFAAQTFFMKRHRFAAITAKS
jgi:hypothetical protein